MNPSLQQLKDIHLPQTINMFPIAAGWILFYFISLTLIIYLIYFLYQRKKQRITIQFAIKQLKQLQIVTKNNIDNINIAAEISTLIRRTSLHYFKRQAVAGLSGQEWLQFLNDSGQTKEFTSETGQLLIDAPYRKQNPEDLSDLFLLVQNWLCVIEKKNKKEK